MTAPASLGRGARVLVFGYGLHGQAVAAALVARGHEVAVVDDAPSDAAQARAASDGIDLLIAPSRDRLTAVVATSTHLIPTPGLPEHHPVFAAVAVAGIPVMSEFDLAREWDSRPVVAITGTNGKTTVTTMVTQMLVAAGRVAVMAGNTELPLVTAIDDPEAELFVVEASSFRLGHSMQFAPAVGTWLNFDADHLDVHASLEVYEAAKARIWADQGPDDVAVANADDPVVMRNLTGRGRRITYGILGGDATVREGWLVVGGDRMIAVDRLARRLPHDVSNALAATVTAGAVGAPLDAAAHVLESFTGLPHRVELIADHDGVRWYNDSKATTPHAVMAGLGGFDSAVLIAGGRNKGVDLTPMRALSPRLRAVVAIGEAASEIAEVFAGATDVLSASSMGEAVTLAANVARSGDAIILSPACTSYDWYENYGARGDDYRRLVHELLGEVAPA